MKIAILTPTFHYFSGIDRVVELQASDYSKRGNDVTVFALEATIKPKGFNLEVLGMPKSLFLQRLYRLFFSLDFIKLSKAVNKLKNFDIVISHFYPTNLIASAAKRRFGVKYIYYNHGIGYSKLFSNPIEKLYMRLFAYLNRLSLSNIDSAVSISKFLRDELKKETGIESEVIYNKIGSRYKKGINGTKIRKKLAIKNNEKSLLFIGRLSPHKNVHTLLNIFDLVNKKLPNVRLVVIGKQTFPNYFKKLKQIANKNVIFKEFVSDKELPHYYAACDLYVTASLWEGFNLPAAEAQACGKKVVAFDVCSHPEIVKNGVLVKKDTAVTNVYVSQKDIHGFASAIIKLLKPIHIHRKV